MPTLNRPALCLAVSLLVAPSVLVAQQSKPLEVGAKAPEFSMKGATRYGEARGAYEATLARERNRARSLFGRARAAELAGDRHAAAAGYREFLELMAGSDGKRPELATAKALVK